MNGDFGWLKVTYVKRCEEEKGEENGAIFRNTISRTTGLFFSNLLCRVTYIEGIQYVNLLEISLVVIEIRDVENSELVVPVNNTLVHHTAFLVAETKPCVLICDWIYKNCPYRHKK